MEQVKHKFEPFVWVYTSSIQRKQRKNEVDVATIPVKLGKLKENFRDFRLQENNKG